MPDPAGLEPLPQATVDPPQRRRLSVIWIIPILAAVVAIGIAVQRIVTEGPTITIVFKSAEGVEGGKTFVKYKDVTIGHVTKVELADTYGNVEITAKISKRAAGLIVDDAKFWVVEPRVTLSGISGLGTLLSGNYIGFQPGKSDKKQTRFTGLDVAPIITDQPGRRFILKARTLGSLGVGSPIYYRQLQAGQVAAYDLSADGKGVDITVFINTPYEKYVTPETRFWNASGIDVSVGAGGVNVRTEGLISLLAGGLAFDAPSFAAPAEPAAANAVFTLYPDQATAMKQPDAVARVYALTFTESVLGLSVGAPVTLLGLPAGEVTQVGLSLNPATMALRPRVLITFYPERLLSRVIAQDRAAGKIMITGSEKVRLQLIRRIVEEQGLRGQLKSGNLLTGQLFVAFNFFPDAPKPKIDWTQDPLELPVVKSTIPDLEAKLTGILDKLDNLPLEAIGREVQKDLTDLSRTLEDTSKLLSRLDTELVDPLKTTLEETRRAIASADKMLTNTDATLVGKDAPVQQDLRDALQEMVLAARSLRVLTDYLERHPESLIRGKTQENK
jgi:paraquat-inducible protein B